MQKVFQSSQHCWAGSTMLRSWFLSFASIWLQCCNDGSHEFPVLNDTVDLRYDMTWSTTRIYPVCRRDRNHDFDAFPFNTRVGVLEWRDMNGRLCAVLRACGLVHAAHACQLKCLCACSDCLCLCLCFWSWDDFVLTAARLFEYHHSDFYNWNPTLSTINCGKT